MIEYRLPPEAAQRRALAATAVRAATSLLPVAFALVLLRRLRWAPSAAFWAVVVALVLLVGVRAAVSYGQVRRRLAALRVTVDETGIALSGARDTWAVERGRVARILEIAGTLGGLRIESRPDARSGVVTVVDVPRGGAAWPEVRTAVESFGRIERRPRRGPAMRVLLGGLVVVAIFFLPFLLDDFVARSRLLAAVLVALAWVAMRLSMRWR